MKDINTSKEVEAYFPFIISIVSEITGKYVDVNNSIELSIALEKYLDAVKTFDGEKSNFMTYYKQVIRNAITDYYRKNKRVEVYDEKSIQIMVDHKQSRTSIHEMAELSIYKKRLHKYGLSFDKLVEASPKQSPSRKRLILMAKELATDPIVMEHLAKKKRLPHTYICNNYAITIKVLKTHQKYIIGILVAYEESVEIILNWIELL